MKVEQALKQKQGEVELKGWVYRVRKMKNKVFIFLRDSTEHIQVIFDLTKTPEAEKLTQESSLIIKGDLKEDARAPGGAEVHASSLEIVSIADRFPIEGGESEAFLLDNRHLWLRSKQQNHVMKVRNTLMQSARDYFQSNDFFEVTPPEIVGSACEGGSTLFDFKYFDDTAYLSQSAQMHLEALIFNLEKVYSFSESFRAEKSRTRRHLTEYTHLEAEMAWMEHEDNLRVQEDLVNKVIEGVLDKNESDLKGLSRDPKTLEGFLGKFERVKYEEALSLMNEKGVKMKWGDDFGADEERVLTQDFDKPFFVTHYPIEAKAFYMKETGDGKTVKCADLLAPEGFGEIIGGSERSLDVESMKKRLGDQDLAPYEWYFDLRRFGSVPHSGFGLGVERVLMWLCNLEHVRDAVPFPRVINRSYP